MLTTLRARVQRTLDRWLFKFGGAESGEVFLGQRRVFIVPTGAGFGYGAMLVVLFIGAINYNLGMGFALTFLLAACGVVDLHLTFRNLAYLYLASGRAPTVHAGEAARFEMHVANRSRYDRYALQVRFINSESAGPGRQALPVDVPANSVASMTLSTPARQRGWLPAPRVRLETRFPLGLLRAWSIWQPDAKVLVYPQPEKDAPPLPMADAVGRDGDGPAGAEDFAGIRSYQAGDSLKRLAWRQIARLDASTDGGLLTKHFEGGAASELVFDFDRLPPALNIEQRLSRLTRWVIEAEARGLPYAFRLGETSFAAALGPAHQGACLRALALHGSETMTA
ncbi:MAG: hypothetical protein JWR22_1853 [Herminiimonas sp.]|nr:hypothetical protein [Herminiimonas sp.]